MELIRKVRYASTNRSHIMAIPRPVLNHLKLEKGDNVEYILNEDGTVILKKVEEEEEWYLKSVFEELKEYTQDKSIDDMYRQLNGKCFECGHELTIGVKRNKNVVMCPVCKKSWDIIDCLKSLYGVNENLDLLRKLREEKRPVAPLEHRAEVEKRDYHKEEEERKIKVSNENEFICRTATRLTSNGIKYFKDRHILQALKLLDKDTINIQSSFYKGREGILYTFKKDDKTFGVRKSLEKYKDKKGKVKRFVRNLGQPMYYLSSKGANRTTVIVEGIEDGLSALILGYTSFICLNSVANANTLMNDIKADIEQYKDLEFIMCLDNDKTGIDTMEQLEIFFSDNNLKYNISDCFFEMQDLNLKDLNDLLKYKNKGVNLCKN